jgi:hypothetical protein
MASSGNTWCKKLMTKAKKNAMAHKLGTSQRFAVNDGDDYEAAQRPALRFGRQPRRFGSKPSALPPQS